MKSDLKFKKFIATFLFSALLIVCIINNYRENSSFEKTAEVKNDIKENFPDLSNFDENEILDSDSYIVINDTSDKLIKEISKADSIESFLKNNKIKFKLFKINATAPEIKTTKDKCEYISDKLMIKIMNQYRFGSKILSKSIDERSEIIHISYTLAILRHGNDSTLTHEFYTKLIQGKNLIFWNKCRCE